MDFRRYFASSDALTLALILSIFLVSLPSWASVSNAEIQTLEKDFHKISNQVYSSLAKNLSKCRSRTDSLKSLNKQLESLTKTNQSVIGICLIKNHLPLIKENIDNKESFPIFKYLLDNNNLQLAEKMYRAAKNEGDLSLVSNYSYHYAKYYLKRKQWKKVLSYIEGSYNDLSDDNANNALLFTGIALQKIKKHRVAVKIYNKIPKKSKYYIAARLNMATAYIRQDWWTDAHTEINNILKSKTIKNQGEMINRLYLILGYSLLRKEFYRDSRDAFRNVEVDSIYFNKALLGIALTATNQEDFISALNAINILTEKKSFDLTIDESHLLLPYIYEKLEQNLTASASYTDAQTYYKKRIENIKFLKNKKQLKIDAKTILDNNQRLNINNNIVDFSKHYPVSFLENSAKLDEFSKYIPNIKSNKLIKKYQSLKASHSQTLLNIVGVILDKKLLYLNSYMNQSRFGLARLFDNSNTAQN